MSKLIFAGSPEPAVPALRALVGAGHEVAMVVSRADARRGRGTALSPSPVKAAAVELGIPVTDRLDDVLECGAELGVVVAYGRIVPARVLDVLPMLNVHFSLLPRWRGAAPVERAILAGDTETGVCIMRLEAGLDTGPVVARRVVDIGPDESAAALIRRLADLGAATLVDVLADGAGAVPAGDAQGGESTYAAKIDPAELEIDWRRSAEEIVRLVRIGRAWTTWSGGRLGVLEATAIPSGAAPTDGLPHPGSEVDEPPGTLSADGLVRAGRGLVRLVEVKPEGRRAVVATEWLRGARGVAGSVLGRPPDQ